MARVAGTGKVQKWVLAEVEQYMIDWEEASRTDRPRGNWVAPVNILAWRWANRDMPPQQRAQILDTRRPTRSDIETIRRAAASLYELGMLDREPIITKGEDNRTEDICWGYCLPLGPE